MIQQLFQSEVFTIMFVIGLYLACIKLYRTVRFALFHPVLLTIIILIALLMSFDVPYQTFREGSRMIHFMLGPSVVALGYILYQQVGHLKGNVISIMVAITVGAMVLAGNNGGVPGLTSVIVVCAGILGSMIGPPIMKLMGIKSPVAKGLAMGASSHGIGTAAAIQMGAIEGALSGLAIGIMGLITSLLLPLFSRWFG